MSDGDDVLDNWEEIDEAGLDSKLDQIKKDIKSDDKQLQDPMASFGNNTPFMMVMPEDEYKSTSYTQAKPVVKILRRPQQNNDSRANDNRPKQPIKTLKQREQEYAEARLRILGSAKNPEDELESSAAALSVGTSSSSNNTSSRISTNETKNSNLNGQILLTMPILRAAEQSTVLRMPKGPDGTGGFNVRR